MRLLVGSLSTFNSRLHSSCCLGSVVLVAWHNNVYHLRTASCVQGTASCVQGTELYVLPIIPMILLVMRINQG